MPATSPSPSAGLFNWLDHRAAGVLVHPTSLPSAYGVGAFDATADALLDFLQQAKMKYWQVCPLGPTGYGDSPYQCFSSFAGNPYLIDPAPLAAAGLVEQSALAPLRNLSTDRVDYGALYQLKLPLLFSIHARWKKNAQRALPYGDFNSFRLKNQSWLSGYALFSALKDHFGGKPWWEWPADVRTFAAASKS